MALFQPCKVLSSKLNSLAKAEGQFIICTDTGEMYLDTSNTTRILCASPGLIPENPSDTSNINIWIETV